MKSAFPVLHAFIRDLLSGRAEALLLCKANCLGMQFYLMLQRCDPLILRRQTFFLRRQLGILFFQLHTGNGHRL